MFRSAILSGMRSKCGRWCGLVAAIACLGLSSCTNLSLYREDGFRDLPSTDSIRPVSPGDGQSDFFGASNKAREIERNLGM